MIQAFNNILIFFASCVIAAKSESSSNIASSNSNANTNTNTNIGTRQHLQEADISMNNVYDLMENVKRAWKDLPGSGWGKRSWQDLPSSGWGKRGWQDLQTSGWGKRGWQDLQTSGWGKRAWKNMPSSGWGKRNSQQTKLWGKNDETLSSDGIEDYIDAPVILEDSLEAAKRAWNSLRGTWGKRDASDWGSMKGAWGKRDPAWHNLKGLWGKRSPITDSNESNTFDIPGVNSETTVSDIMETLFGSSNIQYTIMQKWRQIERPLNGNTKILKLWKTWGDAKSQVKLSLTKVVTVNNLTNSNAISTKKRNNLRHTHDQAKHSKRLTQSPKSCNFEKLLKVILLQRKTIQTQIYIAIEQLEAEQNNEGFDLLDAMSILKTSKCSKITAQHSEIELKKLKREIHQLKKVVKINKKLESKEEHLIKLFTGIECFKKNNQMLNALKFDVNKIKKSKHKWRKTN